MNHRDTDTKALPEHKPVTAEQIDRAIAWYEAHVESIAAALPIRSPGVLYKVGSLELLERFILAWKDETMSLQLAAAYIHRPLTIFYKALEQRDVPGDRSSTGAE